ncbi:uncharacterized protein LOC135220519 [Macrobrachium nipponense]|uniref:uncharacterized protein LOC135220519 n=1 Tax=Macrobrachium nipponense TaxID=159736 RepID=UPI0030C83106
MALTKSVSPVSQNAHTCIQCGKIFRNSVKYMIHKSKHTSHITFISNIRKKYLLNFRYRFCWKKYHVCNFFRKAYCCGMCQKSFISERTVVNHLKNCPCNTKHKCLFCDYTSNSQSDIINHTKQHADEQPYQCTKCDKKFVSLGELTDHELVHLPPRYLCFTCGKVFAEKNVLKNHLEAHRGKQLCIQCGKEYSGEDYFCHTEVVSALCKKCGSRFKYLCLYEKHKKMHGEVVKKMKHRGKHLCIHCGKEYLGKDHIFHMEFFDELSPCRICGLHFDYICMYEKHKKGHIEALENIKTCRTRADLCQFIECSEMVVSQAPLIYGYNHVCMICGKGFKDFPSTLVHIEGHVKIESGMTGNVASSVCKASREPVNDFQGFDKQLNSNKGSSLTSKHVDVVVFFNATKRKKSSLESDMQLSLKPREEVLKYNSEENIGLKVNRNYCSVNLSTRSLPHSSYDSQVDENLPGPSKSIKKKVMSSGYSFSSSEDGSLTIVDHGLTFSKYKAVMAEVSQKISETGESKMKQSLVEPCSLEKVCPSVSSTLGGDATSKSNRAGKSPIASPGKCVSDDLSRSRLILSEENPSSNNEGRVNIPKDRIALYRTETKALNKKEKDVQEDICGEVVKDENNSVPSFDSVPRDTSKHREDSKSFGPFVNNLMVRDSSLEYFHSCNNDSQTDTENKIVNQVTNVKKVISLPCNDGKVEGMHKTQTALSDIIIVDVASLEKSFSGTVSQGVSNEDSSSVENMSIEDSRTLGVNLERNHYSKTRDKYNVENKQQLAGQSYVSSLAKSLEAINCTDSDVVKDLSPNKKTIQNSENPQVKIERSCLPRKRKFGRMWGRNAHKKCPSCGIMVLCKLSTHAKTCFKQQEEDCLQQSDMSLENSRSILPLSVKLENCNSSVNDVKNQHSENVGDNCGQNGTIADNGYDLKNMNNSKGILKRTFKNARESDKLQYVCKEISSKSYVKDSPYCTLCGKVFAFKSSFEAHKQLHEKAGWYLCYKCGIAYRNERNLVRHCEIAHFGEYVFEFEQEKFVPVRKTGRFSNRLVIRKNVSKRYGDSQTGVFDKSGHFECRHCRGMFRCKSVLKIHLESHKNICLDKEFKLIKIQCSVCNMKFKDRGKLKIHWQSHKNSQLFTCIVCGKAFSSEDKFLYHKCMQVKHGNILEEKYVNHENQNVTVDAGGEMDEESTSSNKSSKKKSVVKVEGGLSCQAEIKNKNQLYKCPACRRRFENREVFAAHVVKHEKAKWYICVDCSLCFWLKEGLKEHSMYAHSEHWVTDKNTSEETTSSQVESEVTSSQVESEVVSSSQVESEVTSSQVESEVTSSQVESEVKQFLCSVCGDKYHCQETFKQHILQHENENWCICGDCGNCYRDRGNLFRHEKQYHGKIHDDILTTEKEKNNYKTSRTVKVIVERMSPCNVCGMYYGTSKTDLEKHLTTHAVPKKKRIFKCTLCLRTFKNRKLFLSHKIMHSSQKQRSSVSLREKNIVNLKKSSSFKLQGAHLQKRYVYKKGICILKSSAGPLCSKKPRSHRNLLLQKKVEETNLLYHRKKLLGSSARKFVCLSCDSKFFFKVSLDNHNKKYHRHGAILGSVSKDIYENVPD